MGTEGISTVNIFETMRDPVTRRDPHPLYHRLRSEQPIAHVEEFDEYILTRWADCEAVLRDPKWSSSPEHRPIDREGGPSISDDMDQVGMKTLLFLDPPDHTRLRRLVSKAFTPRRIEQLREHVAEILDELLADVKPGEPFDVISTFAYPLPLIVICELMGVPLEDRHQFEGWSADATRLLDGDIDEETFNKGIVAAMYFLNYFNSLFEQRRADPKDDLVSGLLAVEEAGDVLTEEELRSIVLLVFLAGHETTVNLIGNGLFALMQHRDQWDRLCADPDGLKERAVEELLRFDGPVHVTGRAAVEDVQLAGETFAKQSQVVVLLAAANRDPERFPEPDRLDIGREDNQHLTFSHGIHYCLGAALARLEGQVVFSTLAKRYPDMQLAAPADDIEYRDHFVLRGLKALPVTI
jgi:cytochrome P450